MSLQSLVQSGTKVWLDSIDPETIRQQRPWGITGATSNPIIISDLIKTGRFDRLLGQTYGRDDAEVAWQITDELVREAQEVFRPVWDQTNGNDGYVSFELDPLLEDPEASLPRAEAVRAYIDLANKWGLGRANRLIKVPATEAGIEALEEIVAAGINVNVTLIFSLRQYRAACAAVWRGAQRREDQRALFKSVYSVFVSRVDVYTEKNVPTLTAEAQGLVGIVNAKRMWKENEAFWRGLRLPLKQEMIFASTGTKKESDAKDKYVEALAGSDIQTNPPATNEAVEHSGKVYTRKVELLPPELVLLEIDAKVDQQQLEETLMSEGVEKFAKPQKALLKLIGDKRKAARV